MDTSSPTQRTAIRFGVFEVDCLAGEVRKQGIRIKLQGQPFQVLQILLEQPGQIVTREQLRQRIWPADTFVDFEGGVSNAVKRLREALGDSAETPRFIETLPRRGYRFVGTIEGIRPVTPADESPPKPNRPTVPPASRRALRTVSLIGLGLVALVIVILALVPRNWRQRLRGASDVPAIHSLAVLPLQNLSGDPAQDYFADGMTEELITELSGISALKVISHTSTARYKKTSKSLPEIAHELNVDAIVEGSVVRSADRVRITAQLIYAPEDKNLWARSYQREVGDSLTLQSEVALAIAEEVRAQVAPVEQARLQRARPVNLKALDLFFQGDYHLGKFGRGFGLEEAEKAIKYYHQAIADDPSFAKAYLRIAGAYDRESDLLSAAQVVPLEKEAAEKAVALDPNLAEAHVWLAAWKSYEWDWQGAEKELRRAIELDPNSSDAHDAFADCLDGMGRVQEGMIEHRRAQELDPAGDHLSNGLLRSRQYDQAIEFLTKRLEIAPEDGGNHFKLSETYATKGMYEESIRELRLAMILYGYQEYVGAFDRAYAKAGYKGAIRYYVQGLEQLYAQGLKKPCRIAEFYVRLGDKDRAFKWLQTAYEEHELDLEVPYWDPVRSDPRFKDLVRRIGLSP